MTFSTGTKMQPINLSSPIFSDPIDIDVSEIAPLTITTNASGKYGTVNLSTLPRDLEVFGHKYLAATYYMLSRQAGAYVFWPFRDGPSDLTLDGRALFVNTAWYAIKR